MHWYRFKLWQCTPHGLRFKYTDGAYALNQDVALAYFLDRADELKGWNYTAERCLTTSEDLNAQQLRKMRTIEISLDDLTDAEFVEWMSQPAYQGAK